MIFREKTCMDYRRRRDAQGSDAQEGRWESGEYLLTQPERRASISTAKARFVPPLDVEE